MEFKLQADFIELDNLLKVLELAAGGAQARQQIQAGRVKVNGQVESRVRRKLRPGDCVEFSGQKINIVTGESKRDNSII
jgi:ribosome-associated protein